MRFIRCITVGAVLASFALAQGPSSKPASRPSSPASRPADATRIYFVRHAEAMSNVRSGEALSDEEKNRLTERGIKQAEDAARRLRSLDVVALYSSPAGRARRTAEALAAARSDGLKVAVADEIGPLKDGVGADGSPFPNAARMAAWRKGEDIRPEKGESLADVRARCVAFVKRVAKERPRTSVLVVAHSEVGAMLVAESKEKPSLETLMTTSLPNASVHVFDVVGDRLVYVGPLEAAASR
jgi:phosphoserine phosphatase